MGAPMSLSNSSFFPSPAHQQKAFPGLKTNLRKHFFPKEREPGKKQQLWIGWENGDLSASSAKERANVRTPGEWLDDPKFKATEGDFLKPKLGNGLDRAKPKH